MIELEPITMHGIILGGGKGTRLQPITHVLNKHILPVLDKPMFYYPLETMIRSGIKKVAIVYTPPHGMQLKQLYSYFPLKNKLEISFVLQQEAKGMADAIGKCAKAVKKDKVFVLPGDNIFIESFKADISKFDNGAVAFLHKVNDPERFGVPQYDSKGKLISIIEKPLKPASNWVVTAPYLFDQSVFEVISRLKPSKRGELEVTSLLLMYLQLGKLSLIKRRRYWKDVGTFESLNEAGSELLRRSKTSNIKFK